MAIACSLTPDIEHEPEALRPISAHRSTAARSP
jgi:hypothetical protein